MADLYISKSKKGTSFSGTLSELDSGVAPVQMVMK